MKNKLIGNFFLSRSKSFRSDFNIYMQQRNWSPFFYEAFIFIFAFN